MLDTDLKTASQRAHDQLRALDFAPVVDEEAAWRRRFGDGADWAFCRALFLPAVGTGGRDVAVRPCAEEFEVTREFQPVASGTRVTVAPSFVGIYERPTNGRDPRRPRQSFGVMETRFFEGLGVEGPPA